MGGKLIVFEGIDGTGKTYQCSRVAKMLNDHGFSTFQKSFPSNNNVGASMRNLANIQTKRGLSHNEAHTLSTLAILDFGLEGKMIQELLASGFNIVCDRYILSAFAYNLVSTSVSSLIDDILLSGHPFSNPHLTIYLRSSLNIVTPRLARRNEKVSTRILHYASSRFDLASSSIPNLSIIDTNELSLSEISPAVDLACLSLFS